jgi:5-methylcytosine-specific restriction endonuclease McrA
MKVFDKEYRKKLSDAQRKLWRNPEYRASHCKAFSEGHKGTKKPLEVRQKISIAQIGVPKPTSGVRGPKHHRWNPNKSAFKEYRRLVQRETEKNYRLHRQAINPLNLLRAKCGIEGGHQLDHRVSVKEGFEKQIPVYEISHINNLQMLSWQENRKKGV